MKIHHKEQFDLSSYYLNDNSGLLLSDIVGRMEFSVLDDDLIKIMSFLIRNREILDVLYSVFKETSTEPSINPLDVNEDLLKTVIFIGSGDIVDCVK